MDETIGAKGGKNDHRRTLLITKEQYEKLLKYKEEQKFKEEKAKLKKNQIKSLITIIPIVLTGTICKELISPPKKEQLSEDSVQNLKRKNPINRSQNISSLGKTAQSTENTNSNQIKQSPEEKKSKVVEIVEQNHIPQPKSKINSNLENIKNHEIIARYEAKLKEVKRELKKLIYEYNIIVEESENIYESTFAQELLDKLTMIIKKIEYLKKMIDIPNMEDYDQNYIYNLISEYLSDFEKSQIVADIKDSDLYILISSKIQELEEKKEKLTQELMTKKESINIDEEKLEQLKKHRDSFDNFNNLLLRFQSDQDYLIKDLEIKIANATSEQEKVTIKLRFLENRAHAMLDLLKPQLLIPGAKSGFRLAVATASLIHIMHNHLRPKTEIRRYRILNITDYSKDITNSIDSIDKTLKLLSKSKKELQQVLKEFQENYQSYFGKVKECDKLLDDLETILSSLIEKEEELENLRLEQERNLDKNNEKVKQIRHHETPQF